MTANQRWAAAGLCFLAGALAVLAVEIRLAQRETDALARRVSMEIARMGGSVWGLDSALWRVRGKPEASLALFDHEGRKVAEANGAQGGGGHGVVFAVRSGVRDPATGRELLHLVVHRDIRAGLARAGLAGLAAALLAGFVLWVAGRGGKAAPA